MLEQAVFIVGPVMAVLFIAYFYRKKARKQEIEQTKVDFSKQVQSIKKDYKVNLEVLKSKNTLTGKQVEGLWLIASNFFVFQPVSAESIARLKKISEMIVVAIKTKQDSVLTEDEQTALTRLIDRMLKELPTSGSGFNKAFYEQQLPSVINTFAYSSLSSAA